MSGRRRRQAGATESVPTSASAERLAAAVRHHRAGRLRRAEAIYEELLEARPDYPEALQLLGVVKHQLGDGEAAVDLLRKAVAVKPDYAKAHSNLGAALVVQGKLDEAAACCRTAISLEPDLAEAHSNLGEAFKRQGKLDAAIDAYGCALAADPGSAEARHARALAHLLLGNFAAGWRDYRYRPSMRGMGSEFLREPLAPELRGKRILVVKDQGLGDEIYFLRFGPRLKARGAWIAYRADPKIAAMVGRLPFIDRLVAPDERPEAVDLVLSVGELPYLLGIAEASEIPPSVELPVLSERVAEMRARLASLGPPPYIGVTWRAGTQGLRQGLSKIGPFEGLAAALRPIGGTVVVLQRNPAEGEIDAFADALGRGAHDLTSLNDDYEGMLALVDLLDEYACVSSLNVQLRAARGRASRVLVPSPPEFRWMATGAESPWFPGTKLYRQTAGGDWGPALEALERDLAAPDR